MRGIRGGHGRLGCVEKRIGYFKYQPKLETVHITKTQGLVGRTYLGHRSQKGEAHVF